MFNDKRVTGKTTTDIQEQTTHWASSSAQLIKRKQESSRRPQRLTPITTTSSVTPTSLTPDPKPDDLRKKYGSFQSYVQKMRQETVHLTEQQEDTTQIPQSQTPQPKKTGKLEPLSRSHSVTKLQVPESQEESLESMWKSQLVKRQPQRLLPRQVESTSILQPKQKTESQVNRERALALSKIHTGFESLLQQYRQGIEPIKKQGQTELGLIQSQMSDMLDVINKSEQVIREHEVSLQGFLDSGNQLLLDSGTKLYEEMGQSLLSQFNNELDKLKEFEHQERRRIEGPDPEVLEKVNVLKERFETLVQNTESLFQEYKQKVVFDRGGYVDVHNSVTTPNQSRVSFRESGLSSDKSRLKLFTTFSRVNDETVRVTTKTKDGFTTSPKQGFHVGNTYSSKLHSMDMNSTGVSGGVVSGSEVVNYQAGQVHELLGIESGVDKPQSIRRHGVINTTTNTVMSKFKHLPQERQKLTVSMEKLKGMTSTRVNDQYHPTESEISGIMDRGLTQVETFLLCTPNGGSLNKMLKDIDEKTHRIKSVSLEIQDNDFTVHITYK